MGRGEPMNGRDHVQASRTRLGSLNAAPALARKIAATEFDSAWQAMCAARMPGANARDIAFLIRVAADELRHARYFERAAAHQDVERSEIAMTQLAGLNGTVSKFFADLVAGESNAQRVFSFYGRTRRELSVRTPDFSRIQSDEAFHSFGALLHLRRHSHNRRHAIRMLRGARLRVAIRALSTAAASLVDWITKLIATGVLLLASVVLRPLARRRLARSREAYSELSLDRENGR